MAVPLDEFVETVEHGLDMGWSTEIIYQELGGIQHDSVMLRLRRHGFVALAARLGHVRTREWEVRMPFSVDTTFRHRCAHGWWSRDGRCPHGPKDLHDIAVRRWEARRAS